MDVVLDLIATLSRWSRGHLHDIALAIMATLLVLFGPALNAWVQQRIGSLNFLFRTLLFVLLCAVGYGLAMIYLTPWLAKGLNYFNNYTLAPVLHISELRTIKGDELWLSPTYGRDSVAFHFTWIRDLSRVLPVVALVESVLLPLGARPHWGKVTTVDLRSILPRYERAADFAALRRRLDPDGKFANAYTSALFD